MMIPLLAIAKHGFERAAARQKELALKQALSLAKLLMGENRMAEKPQSSEGPIAEQ